MITRAGRKCAAGILAGVLVLAASAGVAGAAAPQKQAPTKDAFITEADAICAAGNVKEIALQTQILGASTRATKAQVKQFGKGIAKIILGEQAELSKLTPPTADKAKIKKLLAELKKAAQKLQSNPSLISTGGGLDKPARLAQAYGFKVCGSGNGGG